MSEEMTVLEAIKDARKKVRHRNRTELTYGPMFELLSTAKCAEYVPQRPCGGPTEKIALMALAEMVALRLASIEGAPCPLCGQEDCDHVECFACGEVDTLCVCE